MGGDAEGSAFVGGGDEAEQQLRSGFVERREPDLVDEQDVVAQEVSMDLPTLLSRGLDRGSRRGLRRRRT